jgi:uncharacterized membrane protein YdfJ with MMPL/SSD domain
MNTAIAITAIIAAVAVINIIATTLRDITNNKHNHTQPDAKNGSKETDE